MERIALADAERSFSRLVQRVFSEGVTVEVNRGDQIIARIIPVGPRPDPSSPGSERIFAGPPQARRRRRGVWGRSASDS